MKIVISMFMLLTLTSLNPANLIINFGESPLKNDWYIVNDDVMGGLSTSSIHFTSTSIIFKGTTSLENNGGFASIRSRKRRTNLAKYSKVKIRCRQNTPNRIFAIRLNTNDVYYKPSFNKKFTSQSNDWQTLEFNLNTFKETILGKETGKMMSIDQLKNVVRVGIMLNDKKQGNFGLEIDYISFE